MLGAGGVGAAIARAAAESEVLERVVVADLELGRASAAVDRCADTRFVAYALDASNATVPMFFPSTRILPTGRRR